MTIRRLEKPQWRPFFDAVSKLLEAKDAKVEVASLVWATRRRQNGCRCLASATILATMSWTSCSMDSIT